jgi:hypothetical protein
MDGAALEELVSRMVASQTAQALADLRSRLAESAAAQAEAAPTPPQASAPSEALLEAQRVYDAYAPPPSSTGSPTSEEDSSPGGPADDAMFAA